MLLNSHISAYTRCIAEKVCGLVRSTWGTSQGEDKLGARDKILEAKVACQACTRRAPGRHSPIGPPLFPHPTFPCVPHISPHFPPHFSWFPTFLREPQGGPGGPSWAYHSVLHPNIVPILKAAQLMMPNPASVKPLEVVPTPLPYQRSVKKDLCGQRLLNAGAG